LLSTVILVLVHILFLFFDRASSEPVALPSGLDFETPGVVVSRSVELVYFFASVKKCGEGSKEHLRVLYLPLRTMPPQCVTLEPGHERTRWRIVVAIVYGFLKKIETA
jgi:hypothetical protein